MLAAGRAGPLLPSASSLRMYVLIYLIVFIYAILLLTKPSIFTGFGRMKTGDSTDDGRQRGCRRLQGGGG